jgi:hypothetical protein
MPKASKESASEHETLEGDEEVFEAGDAYYVGSGHTPVLYAGTEVVEFSPTEELGRTLEVVSTNMQAMQASS